MAKLPTVTSQIPPDLRRFLDRIREAFDTGLISETDLINSGAFQKKPGGGIDFIPDTETYCGTPAAPTNLSADGAMTSILLSWEGWDYGTCAGYTEIWRADVDDIGLAVLVGTSGGGLYADAVGSNAKHYYWVRFVNTEGDIGPYNATAGTLGETAPDILYLLDMLEGQLTESQLYQSLVDRIDLIDGDPSTPGTLPYQIDQSYNSAVSDAADAADTAISDAIDFYDRTVVNGNTGYISQLTKKINDGDDAVSGTVTDLSMAVYGNPNATPGSDEALGSLAVTKRTIENTAAATYATARDQDLLVAAIYGPEFDISNPLTLDQLTSGTIYEEREVRASQFETVSQAIEVLTVGAGEGMDSVATWFFDTALENWTGTYYSVDNYFGFLRTTSVDTSSPTAARVQTVLNPDGTALSFSGATYNHIRIRGRRSGGAADSWNFRIYFRTNGTWKLGYTDEPRDISQGEYFVVNADMSSQALWTGGTVTGIRLYMSANRDDLFDIDYVSVGRLGVAASTATVYSEREARIAADGVQAQNLQKLEAKYEGANAWITSFDEAYSNGDPDANDQFSATTSIKALQSSIDNARAWIASYDDTFTDANTSAARSLDSLGSEIGINKSWINNLDDTFVSSTGATSYSLNQISTTIGDNTSAIEVHAESIDGLRGEYTVKIDNDGYVAGFGLANTKTLAGDNIPGSNFSEFTIVADKFSIAPVNTPDRDAADGSPFFYLTNPTTINGEVIPAGAYMKSAFIHDASITNAKIGKAAIDDAKISSLSAAKITFGEMDGDRIKANTLDADRIISDTLVTRLAAITTAYIDTANINEGQITNALIDDATIKSAKIGYGEIKSANIDDAAIQTAHIGTAQVDTLQIKGQAVTIPSSSYTASAYDIQLGSTNEPFLASVTYKSTGAPVMINISAQAQLITSPDTLKYGSYNLYARVYREQNNVNTLLYSLPVMRVIRLNTEIMCLGGMFFSSALQDTPAAGNVTYRLKCYFLKGLGTETSPVFRFGSRFIGALEVKR